jgi:hypothetical protein
MSGTSDWAFEAQATTAPSRNLTLQEAGGNKVRPYAAKVLPSLRVVALVDEEVPLPGVDSIEIEVNGGCL